MSTIKKVVTSVAAFVAISAAASAGSLTEQFTMCVTKFADRTASATVMLECTAGDGHLSACKVLEAPTPSKGFDKAAMCVAEAIPVGSKTGTIKVPLKFDPA